MLLSGKGLRVLLVERNGHGLELDATGLWRVGICHPTRLDRALDDGGSGREADFSSALVTKAWATSVDTTVLCQ